MEYRKIIHIDMDAFYASVEQRDNLELRGRPVAVGGSSLRGVVASASYEARKFGVRSAMPSVTAKRLCPQLIFVKSRFDVYREVSQQIRNIFHGYTDLIEPLSLDEAYLDVTQNKKQINSGTIIAEEIRKEIFEKTQLTASAGVSFNKFLAKVASDVNKPNGIKVITPDEAEGFINQLPIERFHGIGKVTAKKMHNMGIYKGKDLKQITELELIKRFGKVGRHYYKIVRGDDPREVNPNRVRKSIGAERTYSEDLSDFSIMKEKLTYLSEIVFRYMQKADNYGRTISIKVKAADFTQITRSKSFPTEVKKLEDIISITHELLDNNQKEIEKVRLLGVYASNLAKEQQMGGIQLELDFESYL